MNLLKTFRPLWIPGLFIAVLRLISEFASSDKSQEYHASMMLSVYATMPCLWLAAALSGHLSGQSAGRIAKGAALVAVIIWLPAHLVGYGAAQFQEWNFGRYTHDTEFQNARLQAVKENPSLDSAAVKAAAEKSVGREEKRMRGPIPGLDPQQKAMTTLMVSLITTAIGVVYNLLLAGLCIGLIGRFLHRKRPATLEASAS